MTSTTRRYYGIEELRGSRFSVDDRLAVYAFASPSERQAWVDGADLLWEDTPFHGRGGGDRRAASPAEARRAMREIMKAVHGGRQSGREALRQVSVSRVARAEGRAE